MLSIDNTLNLRSALGVGLILAVLGGCSGTSNEGTSSVGGTSNGGAPTGGVSSSTAAGGSLVNNSGGALSTGGAHTTGGASSTGGMMPATGGRATGGSGAVTGGHPTGGASAATGGTRATGGATAAGGGCQKGQVKSSEVLFIGDSFIALNRSIPSALQTLARNAGALAQSATYRDNSVSGTTLQGTGQIPSQYTNGVNAGAVKVVLMDGGGNDCLQRNDAQGAVAPATALFQTMAANGTQYVVYFFYPDPQNNATLKTCIDTLRPLIKNLCDSLTTPKCYFIDLRPIFAGNYSQYILSDGIHPTTQGGAAAAQAIWDVMQANCIAQ